jgi:UPF0755 protein
MAKKTSRLIRFSVLPLLALLALILLLRNYQQFSESQIAIQPSPAAFTVNPGDGLNKVLPKMRAAGITAGFDWQWKILASRMEMAGKIHVGDYEIPSRSTPTDILTKLATGDTARIKFTIIEGWNFRQLQSALENLDGLENDISKKSGAQIMSLIGRPGVHPEGRFLPDTYFIPKSGRKSDVLRQAADAMDSALAKAWQDRNPEVPLSSAEQLLILASIVEKETGQAAERPQIAGVFTRRLKLGMRLQTDPTVIYGIGETYDGNIRRRDLRTDTPYNTYTRAGLPPTPIAMPGKAALQAAANPADGDALYFVASGNGQHVFSANYEDHKKAVATYQLKQ